MPLDIDLNVPSNDLDAYQHLSNMPLAIDLNAPCSTVPDQIEIDLNLCPSHEEEDVTGDGYGAVLSNDDIDNNIGELGVDEVHDMSTGIDEEDELGAHDVQDMSNGGDEEEGRDILNEGIDGQDEAQPSHKKRCFLDNNQRQMVSQLLKNSSCNGKLNNGTVKLLASSFSVSKNVIYRIWRQLNETGNAYHKKINCGRKRVEIDIEKVREVSLAKRSTLRSLACALGTNKTRLRRYLKEGALRRHSNEVKPELKDDNMIARLKFCLSMLEESSIPHDPKFKSMYNVVHIDEKWFYMSQKSTNYYLLADENDPYRTCKNKNFICKVMFLAAVARPRFDDEGNVTFSGNIGVFPLVNKVPAKRTSVNRASGTLETKPITSITKEVSRWFLINKVLPAIKEKWPREHASETIYIQQDNAPCHISVDDEEFCAAASERGFDIRLTCQPPNSPDLNVLDLGFFRAIQSLQQKEVAKSVDELIEVVKKSYDAFSSKDSNKIFITFQSCMIEIMKAKGSNNYKIPHMKKDVLLREGKLPTQLNCDPELVDEIFEYLHNVE